MQIDRAIEFVGGKLKRDRNHMGQFTPKRFLFLILAAACLWVSYIAGAGIATNVREWLWLRNAAEVKAEILDYEDKYVASGDGQVRQATFTYAYSFDGKQYENTTRHLGPFVSKRESDRIISAAENGRQVPCYINVEQPSESLLSKNASLERFLMGAAFATGFLVGGICLLLGCFLKRYAHQW